MILPIILLLIFVLRLENHFNLVEIIFIDLISSAPELMIT